MSNSLPEGVYETDYDEAYKSEQSFRVSYLIYLLERLMKTNGDLEVTMLQFQKEYRIETIFIENGRIVIDGWNQYHGKI
jgi:hypothetical protein